MKPKILLWIERHEGDYWLMMDLPKKGISVRLAASEWPVKDCLDVARHFEFRNVERREDK